jgi:hypothetical protein
MGVPFSFYNFTALIDLQRGITERAEDSHAEAFSILFCDFEELDKTLIQDSLTHVLRSSDAYVHNDNFYFFILYQTDKFGADVVEKMFEEYFSMPLKHETVSFPKDGESAQELFDALQAHVKKKLEIDLEFLDHDSRHLKV